MVSRDPYEPPIQSPFNTLMVRGWNKTVLIGLTLKASYIYPSVDSADPPNLVISMEAPRILLPVRPTASRVFKAIRLSDTLVSTNALLTWTPFMVAIR